MSTLTSLLCWEIDTPIDQISPVEIEDNKLWCHVRQKIKEVKHYDIPADTFRLWKVTIDRSQLSRLTSEDFLKTKIPLNPILPWLTDLQDSLPTNYVNIIIFQRPPDSPSDLPLNRSRFRESYESIIKQYLSKCRPRMRELVMNADNIPSFLPSWKPDPSADEAFKQHMSELRIPAVGDNRPSLLLHNLGENTTKLEKKRISRIPAVFRCQEHTVLLNTSGSGKTRLVLDGLCHNWGLYFSADAKEIGSDDFRTIIDDFNEYQDFERAKAINETQRKTEESITHIQAIASRGLYQLLLSRFLLLELLVEEVEQNQPERPVSSLQNRRLWVLLQAQPKQIFGADLFRELARLLRPAKQSYLKTQIRSKCQALSSRLNLQSFYSVLDEAQNTVDPSQRDYFSGDRLSRRPLLREIWLSWTAVLGIHEMKFIVSGTGINHEEVMRTLSSNVVKQENYEIIRDVGAFDNPKDQAAYIQLYIPANWMDGKWKEFLKRSWVWFRGRHRNTATLVSLILQVGYGSPHRTINSYVEFFTDFRPTDADSWTSIEPGHPPLPVLGKLNSDRMNPMQAKTLAGILLDQMLYGTYSLMGFSAEERATFVECGFARTTAGPISPQTVLDEPIAILAAMNWINRNPQLSFSECLRNDIGKHSNTGNGFENYLAFYVRNFFETSKKLDTLFEFRSDSNQIDWKSGEFELVTVSHAVGSDQPHVSTVTPSSGPSSNIGLRAKTGEDVLAWISKNQDQFTFCFPPKHFGSDLIFFIRSIDSNQLLMIMLQAKNYCDVPLKDLIQGVRTVTPDWFWKSKATKYKTAATSVYPQGGPRNAQKLARQTHKALANIPCGLTVTNGKYPILRIFASWPGDSKLSRSMKNLADDGEEDSAPYDDDLHPLATLHLHNFNSMNKEMDQKWFSGDAEQKEAIHAKRSAGSTDLDMPKSKRARKQAPKIY